MAENENGFEEQAKILNRLAHVDKTVSAASLKSAAQYYKNALVPNVPKSLLKKRHMRDQLAVQAKENGDVQVVFNDPAFYWRFVENGTKHQKAQNFAKGTFVQNQAAIEELMVSKIIEEMERA